MELGWPPSRKRKIQVGGYFGFKYNNSHVVQAKIQIIKAHQILDKKTSDFWMAFASTELEKTADDDERYSFLIRTAGSIDLMYCPYETTAEWEFDGVLTDLGLSWSSNRIIEIINEKADLTEAELFEWRRLKCYELALGSDWSCFAWIVPLRANDLVQAWALFLCSAQEDTPPYVKGVFSTSGEAIMALKGIGAVVSSKK